MSYFIPNYEPKSRVITKNFDVEIEDIHFRNIHGSRVNCLLINEEYINSFKVKFNIKAYDVGFAVPFKTEKGMIISNLNMKGKYIKIVESGTVIEVDYHFKCLFTPGVYYTNTTVGGVVDDKRMVLNRIIDSAAFKVQKTEKIENHEGIVICDQYFKFTFSSDNNN